MVERQVSVQTGAQASLEAELHKSLQHDRIGTVGDPSAEVLLLSIQIIGRVKTSRTQHKHWGGGGERLIVFYDNGLPRLKEQKVQ